MRNQLLIVAAFYATLLILPSCGLDCVDKKTGIHKSSETLKEAQAKDLYQFDFVADKPILPLDNGLTLSIKNAWVENSWTYECVDNKAELLRDSLYQFVIEANYKGDPLNSKYWLGNNHLGAVLRFNYSGQDRFVLALSRETSDTLSQNKLTVDTITFTRRLVSR
jgi:hypothetical protein